MFNHARLEVLNDNSPAGRLEKTLLKILQDIIGTLDFNAEAKDIRQGVFHTGVLTRNCGLAATLPQDALKQKPPMVKDPGSLMEKDIRELAGLAFSESILEAAIGMATINSLLETDHTSLFELNAGDLILGKGRDKRIAIVGHFPFVEKLRAIARECWIIEKNPREGDRFETEAGQLIPQADVVGLTGTVFTNHTLEQLLPLCKPEAFIVILGDTTPLSPILFDYGVDAVSGTKVVDPILALNCLSQGANFRQIKGTERVTMMK
jgi:uncharacterized protein (DUF4213/DUF364 family)